jgi:hypothetical protein
MYVTEIEMLNIRKPYAIKIILVSVTLMFSICSYGCAGGYIDEYIPLDPYLSGKVIHFNESVIYFVFNDPNPAKQFGFLYPTFKGKKIIRQILTKYDASNIHNYKPFRSLPTELIKKIWVL